MRIAMPILGLSLFLLSLSNSSAGDSERVRSNQMVRTCDPLDLFHADSTTLPALPFRHQLLNNGLEAFRSLRSDPFDGSFRFHQSNRPIFLERTLQASQGTRPVLNQWRRNRTPTPFDHLARQSSNSVSLFNPWIADTNHWGAVQESLTLAESCECLPASPGESNQLMMTKNALVNSDLDLTWDASCEAPANDYSVHSGTLGSWYSHNSVLCTTAGATAATITPQSNSRYYLIVPLSAEAEGSYGQDSTGASRPLSGSACRSTASFAECP